MKKFDAINSVGENSALFKHSINKERVVVDVDMVLPFFQVCQDDTCSSQCEVKSKKIEGGVLKIFWTCSNGHAGSWASSTVLCEKKGQKVYTNTVLLAAGVFLSSNNFEKIAMFCRMNP